MANLVSPGYDNSALVNSILKPLDERVIEFKGLNRKDFVEEGEMSDMLNMSSDDYPLLCPRKPRGLMDMPAGVKIPLNILARWGKIAMIAQDDENNYHFYFDGTKVNAVTGLSASSEMVAINTKICFFPQKTYIEVIASGTNVTIGSFGSLEESKSETNTAVTISNEDAKITLSSDHTFAYDDAIVMSGTLGYTPSGGTPKTRTCNVSLVIEAVSGRELTLPRETFIELTGQGATDITFTGTVKRTMPSLDMVIEWNNRLWGASSNDNTIYACKLGDPKNWQYYQGTSLDSYYAQQGTDGIWTGCAAYSSHIIFFKQNGMARIYGSSPSNFQITNTKCYGVEEGSRGSVVTINDKVFYKSVIGIMAYDGGTPYCISDKFNAEFRSVVGGSEGQKYYASIFNKKTGPELMVLDIDKAVWHKEDDTRFVSTCSIDNKMYFITQDKDVLRCSNSVYASESVKVGSGTPTSGEVHIINPTYPSESFNDLEWRCVFGPFDEFVENRKIYSKLLLRLLRKGESKVDVFISINEGEWEKVYTFDPSKTGGDYIPIIPRRCDRYSVKLEGQGECCIKSLTRRVRMGTGGRL